MAINTDPNVKANADRNGAQSQEILQTHGTALRTILIAVAIAALVFAIDLMMPLGFAGGVPFVALVLCGWWFPDRSAVMYLAVAGSALTIMGYFYSPEGGIDWVVFSNRALAILAIWSLAAFLWWAWRDRAPRPHQPMGETWLDQRRFLSMGSESFFVAVLVVVIVASSWGAITRIELRAKDDIEKSLKIALETSHASVRKKFETQKKAARFWAKDILVHKYVVDLAALPMDALALMNSLPQEDLRTRMTLLLERTIYRGYFVIGKDNINLASSRDGNIGVVSLLTEQEGFLARIWAGETRVSQPQVSDVPLRDTMGELVENLPTMFVAAPIIGAGGDIIAIFAFRLDPDEMFMPITHLGRFGDSGETYAFNRLGFMISESRYINHLRQLGLTTSKHSDLNLEIRDPGVDMTLGGKPSLPRGEQALTRMAQSATVGTSAMDLEGYRDYRGVPVVGAWLWDDELGFGIASEINVEEAYASFHNTYYVILAFSVLSIGVLMVLALVSSRARKRIASSEKKYRTSIDSTSEGYWRLGTSGRMLEVNQAFCRMLGREPDELLGKIPYEFSSDESREIIKRQAARNSTTNHRSYEVVFIHKLGQAVHAIINATTIWDRQGKVTGTFAFITDITEIKQAEAALQGSKEELEHNIIELEASRTDLERQAVEMIELAENKAVLSDQLQYEVDVKNRFFSIVSHDLKSPFNSLLGMTQMMSQMAENFSKDKLVEYATSVNEAGNQVFVLLSNLLEWSCLQMEGDKLDPKVIPLRELTQESIDILKPMALDKDIALTNEVRKTAVFADRDMVLTVIRNLIANSLKFTPSGGSVDVSSRKDGDMIQVTVADTGVGMSKEHVVKIFDLDQKTSTTGTAGEIGTGLGLPLCVDMLKRNGGRIWVESTPNEGTRFHFTLPVAPGTVKISNAA